MKSRRKRRGKRGGKSKGRTNHTTRDGSLISPPQQHSLLNLLSGPSVQERESACVAIANVFESNCPAHALDSLVEGGLFEKLKSRICDEAPSVRLSACLALLNISKRCSRQMCRRIQTAEIPIVVFSYVDFLLKPRNHAGPDDTEDSIIVALELLSNLYERLDVMTALENNSSLETLFCCMDHSEARVRQYACSLLHLCSEDNPGLSEKLWASPASIQRLVELVGKHKEASELDGLHLCGALSNLFTGRSPTDRQTVLQLILTILNSKLQVDSCFPVYSGPDGDESQAWESRVKVQRLSLEVLTNALIEFGESPVESKQILSLGVEKRLMAFLENGSSVLEEDDLPEDLRAVVAVICERSAGAFDNMVQMLPSDRLAQTNVAKIWSNLENFVCAALARNKEAEHPMLCALTALQWTILRESSNARSLGALSATFRQETVLSLVKLSRSETTPVVRANAFGSLQVVFAVSDYICQREIARAVNSGLGDMSILVVVQALEAVFGIYACTTYDSLYHELKTNGILKGVRRRLRSKQEDSLTTLTIDPRVMSNALVNLEAFIDYKQENTTL